MIWDYIGKNELQGFIGSDIINNLQEIIPSITNTGVEEFDINKKDILVKIVDAFNSSSFFAHKDKILDVLNRISPSIIDACIKDIMPLKLSVSFNDKINFIANQWNTPKYRDKILQWAGLPHISESNQKVKRKAMTQMSVPAHPYKTLKDYQMSVYVQSEDKLKYDRAHFIVQMPTGSGKTRTAMEIVSNFINSCADDVAVVWLAHSEELCDQAEECFEEVWEHVARKPLDIYKCWGAGVKLPKTISHSSFIVGGFQKLYAALAKNTNVFDGFKNQVALIIVDEAHKAIAPSYAAIVKAIGNINTRVIGLTATPGRNMEDAVGNKELSDFFHNESITIAPDNPETSVIEYLRNRGVLSELNIETLLPKSIITLTDKERYLIEKDFDFPTGFLAKLGTDNIRNIEILKSLERECNGGHQIIFFACSIEHSKFICSMLIYLGFKAIHVDGNTDRETRQNVLNQFKSKEIQVVCNFGVLSTGFDAPKTDVVCISRPTTSIVLYSQMIGRGLRGPAIGGTARCKLINVKDNIEKLPKYQHIFDYFEEYWSC
jgi:superfamily II DNA or RNA helicase